MREIPEIVLNPFIISLILLGICSFFLIRQRAHRFVRWVVPICFLVLLATSSNWLANLFSVMLEDRYKWVDKPNPSIHWIVVLGGGQSDSDNGAPDNLILNSASITRMVEGVRLFRSLPQATIILSGGGVDKAHSEANHLNQLAQWFDLPNSHIILDEVSMNTEAQANAIKNIVHEQPFYLVTSGIHMPRAMLLCQGIGLHPIPAPTDYAGFNTGWFPHASNIVFISSSLHELIGMAWGKLLIATDTLE